MIKVIRYPSRYRDATELYRANLLSGTCRNTVLDLYPLRPPGN